MSFDQVFGWPKQRFEKYQRPENSNQKNNSVLSTTADSKYCRVLMVSRDTEHLEYPLRAGTSGGPEDLS